MTVVAANTPTESEIVATPRASFAARVLMLPIRAYRLVSVHLPPRCRYHPSCSAYALEALEVHGGAKGTWLAVKRVGRCHPWHDGGLDPVPPRSRSPRASRVSRSSRNPRPNTCSHDAADHAAEETHR